MNKKHIGIIAVISVIAVCTASIGYITYSDVWRVWVYHYDRNDYSYTVVIESDEELYNLTLYLPILMRDGEIFSLTYDMRNRFSGENMTSEIIDTDYGNMLKISWNISTIGEGMYRHQDANHTINTKNPVGNEPTFYPRVNESLSTYQSYIYVEYNRSQTAQNASLHISLSILGTSIHDVFTKRTSSGYRDSIDCDLYLHGEGYYTINGSLERLGVTK